MVMYVKYKKILLIIFLLLIFIINTIFVITYKNLSIDSTIYKFIFSINNESITKIMKFITFFGSTIFMVLLSILVFTYLLIKKKNRDAYCSVSLIIISTLLNNIVKLIIRRPRPEYITVIEKSYSYPSGHMMASVTMYGFLIYLISKSKLSNKRKKVLEILIATLIIMIGISRIYLGAHYFSDIFGAFILSTILLVIFCLIDDKYSLID